MYRNLYQSAQYIRPRGRERRRRAKSRRRMLLLAAAFTVFALSAVNLTRSAVASRFIDSEPAAGSMPRDADVSALLAKGSWNLLLVNAENPLPEDFTVELTQLANGHSVDRRCYPDLQSMMDACRAEGLSPVICSSYRSLEKQKELFQNKVGRLLAEGYSAGDTETETGREVAVPGTSEHQLGLALDIVDMDNQNLDRSQEDTAVQKWLIAHSWEHGFILRYPNDKSDITGIIYEPWHYRYVGRDAAREIHEQGVCLEEYLENLPD